MDSEKEVSYPVKLYVYDLSHGMAKAFSPQFLGMTIEGVWHTSVVAYGVETYYGAGIQQSIPGKTHHGAPLKIIDMGETQVPPEIFKEMLADINDKYHPDKYDLFDHNCNHMSDEICQTLVGKPIPEDISSLPQSVLATPFGQMLRPMLEQSLKSQVQGATMNAASLP